MCEVCHRNNAEFSPGRLDLCRWCALVDYEQVVVDEYPELEYLGRNLSRRKRKVLREMGHPRFNDQN